MKLLLQLLLSSHLYSPVSSFNFEIERRVVDAIEAFFGVPEDLVFVLTEYRANGGFPNGLVATDRDTFGTIGHSLRKVHGVDMIYVGDEAGVFFGFSAGNWATYREPVNSGYDPQGPLQKYYSTCVDRTTGQPLNCTRQSNAKYIRCLNDCALEKCPTNPTTCHSHEEGDCVWEETYCYQYEIVSEDDDDNAPTGFVPRTYHCHDIQGQYTQTPGMVLQPDGSLGDCLFGDGETPVQRNLVGDFVYCQSPDNDCSNTFVGGYRSLDYDPRYRTWYTITKELQRPTWSQPYVFFTLGHLGITFSHPIYSKVQVEDGTAKKRVFQGVVGVDYTFEDLGNFLRSSYGTADETIVIYERAEPNYLVASSTGIEAAVRVLEDSPDTPCPLEPDEARPCTVIRRAANDVAALDQDPLAPLVHAAYVSQVEADYPEGELVSVQVSGKQAYASQSSMYSAEGDKNLEWVVMVISPVERSETDTIQSTNGLFAVVCAISGLGFILCSWMLVSFLRHRRSRAVVLADWPLTSAFLTGCAVLNLTSLIHLGDNTKALCMARMWSFHFVVACTLSPLFVKVYRMYKLVGSTERNPTLISTTVAFAMTMPIVLIQVAILTIFSIVTPPRPEEYLLVIASGSTGSVTQVVECQFESPAFYITVFTFEFGLLLVGCGLAFAARRVDPGFGQSTELLFSMFNIAFIGIGMAVALFAMKVDMQAQIVLFSLGIFWGTVYSAAAFVVPRLLQAKQDTTTKTKKSTKQRSDEPDLSRTSERSEKKQPLASVLEDSKRSYRPSKDVLSGADVTGWSAVNNDDDDDDDIVLGSRSTTSIVQ